VTSEAGLLDEYTALAERSSGHVRFLLEIIGEDEARHHHLYEQWAASIRAASVLAESSDGIPSVHAEDDPAAVVASAERLIALEEQDAKELRGLRKEIKDYEGTTLWPLLVELMEHDTQKHLAILRFLRSHAKDTLKHRI